MGWGAITMRKLLLAFVTIILWPASASAYLISVDLSGAATGTSIVAPGASFAETFVGQTVVGNGISGSPNNPLTLAPSGSIFVVSWDPVVSPASNSLLPQPGNAAPLSIFLDQPADSITWTMGFGNPPSSIDIDLFDLSGNLVNSVNTNILADYNIYSLSGLGTFSGLTFFNNNDASGLRFMNISYNAVAVPEPGTLGLLLLGLAGLFILRPRRAA